MMSERADKVERKPKNEFYASSDVQQHPIVATVPANDRSLSSMLKLHIDCFEHLFEWLSVADLLTLRQTCKRLKQVVDYFIHSNYPSIRIGYGRITLTLYDDKFKMFRGLDAISLKLVKQISVFSSELKTKEINVFKGVLNQIERLHFYIHRLDVDFYETILKWCTSLKYLSIANISSDKLIGEENRWLKCKYPTIEHVVLDDSDIGGPGNGWEIVELKDFFELNPNIQILSTTMHFLWENRNCWLKSNIKLDRLDVKGDCFLEYGMNRICMLLNKLHEQGFYKRLHMYPVYINNQADVDEIAAAKGLEKLYLSGIFTEIKLPPMQELGEFCFHSDHDFNQLKDITVGLANVGRLFFEEINSMNILYILQHMANVREIKIDGLKEGIYFKDNIIDVCALNNARNQLTGACKLIIYVPESIFLATKWAKTETNYNLIDLKRSEAIEWAHQF